jgi:CheY-like chemotaxis protein
MPEHGTVPRAHLPSPTAPVAPPRGRSDRGSMRRSSHAGVLTATERAELRARGLQRWRSHHEPVLTAIRRTRSQVSTTSADPTDQDPRTAATLRVARVLDRTEAQIDLTEPDPFGRPTTLVAEGHPVDRVLLLHALRQDGRTRIVGDAIDGPEALALTIAYQPDVLVLSEALSGLGCGEVIDEAKRYAPLTRCLVVAESTKRLTAARPQHPDTVPRPVGPQERLQLAYLVVRYAFSG